MEVVVLEVFELAAGGREQLLAQPHVGVHGTARVDEQQHLDRVVPLGNHPDVEPAGIAGGASQYKKPRSFKEQS